MSRAPMSSGMQKFPNAPMRIGVIAKKITSLDAIYALDGDSRVAPIADAPLVEIWRGARCLEYEELLDQFGLEGAREKLAETGSNPSVLDRAIVFQFDEDGQFSFVRLDEGDDPPVYGLNEGEPLTRHCDHFSEYVRLIVDQEFGTNQLAQLAAI